MDQRDRRRPSGPPDASHERRLWREGLARVAGVDEVGRGPLAGPVVAAAVVMPQTRGGGMSRARWIARIRDSKQLGDTARGELDSMIREHAEWGLAVVSPQVIDQINILRATRLAMRRAVMALPTPPDALLVDGREVVDCGVPAQAVIGGDARCVSVAAASIVAKVHRDRVMRALDRRFPGYGLARHKGYATPEHLEALARVGYSSVHRLSFEPVRAALEMARSC